MREGGELKWRNLPGHSSTRLHVSSILWHPFPASRPQEHDQDSRGGGAAFPPSPQERLGSGWGWRPGVPGHNLRTPIPHGLRG